MDRFEFVAGDKVERGERRPRLAQGLSGARASAALGRATTADERAFLEGGGFSG